MNDAILQGGGRSCVVLILANLNHLRHLRLDIGHMGSPLGLDILKLLSSRKYLPKLNRYTYSERLYDSFTFHNPHKNETLALTGSLNSLSKYKIIPEDNSLDNEMVDKSSSVEEISIDGYRLDIRMIKYMLRIPFALKKFSFSYSTSGFEDIGPSISQFCDVMKPQSHNLQDIFLSFPASDWSYDSVFDDEALLGSLQDFHVLKNLTIPFDALLGPDANTARTFSDILPNSLESLLLTSCMFTRPSTLPIWTESDIHRVLVADAVNLASRCPRLRKLEITCLKVPQFKDLMAAMTSQEITYEVSPGYAYLWDTQNDEDDEDDNDDNDYDNYGYYSYDYEGYDDPYGSDSEDEYGFGFGYSY